MKIQELLSESAEDPKLIDRLIRYFSHLNNDSDELAFPFSDVETYAEQVENEFQDGITFKFDGFDLPAPDKKRSLELAKAMDVEVKRLVKAGKMPNDFGYQ